jgi:hypothetical protein
MTIQQNILDKFLAKLTESKTVDADKIGQLRTLMSQGKKLKAEDVVKIFSQPAGDALR